MKEALRDLETSAACNRGVPSASSAKGRGVVSQARECQTMEGELPSRNWGRRMAQLVSPSVLSPLSHQRFPLANSNRKQKAKEPGDTCHARQPPQSTLNGVRRAGRYGAQEGANGEQLAPQCPHFTDRNTESPRERKEVIPSASR